MQKTDIAKDAANMVMISADAVVRSLYEELLQRKADAIELRMKSKGLEVGRTNIQEIVRKMLTSKNFGEKLTSLLNSINGGGRFHFINDVSEHGKVW